MVEARYLVVGGIAFDEAAALSPEQQRDFVQVLTRLRVDPTGHPDLDIEKARAQAADDDRRWMARFGMVDVTYVVDDGDRPAVILIAALPYDDPDELLRTIP